VSVRVGGKRGLVAAERSGLYMAALVFLASVRARSDFIFTPSLCSGPDTDSFITLTQLSAEGGMALGILILMGFQPIMLKWGQSSLLTQVGGLH
jgi:hypothetical protein